MSPRMIEMARQGARPASGVARGGRPVLPLPDESCDRVICYSVWPHFDDRAAVAAELGRVLRPGGSLHVWHLGSRARVNAIHASAGEAIRHDVAAPGGRDRSPAGRTRLPGLDRGGHRRALSGHRGQVGTVGDHANLLARDVGIGAGSGRCGSCTADPHPGRCHGVRHLHGRAGRDQDRLARSPSPLPPRGSLSCRPPCQGLRAFLLLGLPCSCRISCCCPSSRPPVATGSGGAFSRALDRVPPRHGRHARLDVDRGVLERGRSARRGWRACPCRAWCLRFCSRWFIRPDALSTRRGESRRPWPCGVRRADGPRGGCSRPCRGFGCPGSCCAPSAWRRRWSCVATAMTTVLSRQPQIGARRGRRYRAGPRRAGLAVALRWWRAA